MTDATTDVAELSVFARAAAAVPLIWTSHGNLPVESLRYIPLWTVAADRIEFVEEYYLGNELVRRNVHLHVRS